MNHLLPLAAVLAVLALPACGERTAAPASAPAPADRWLGQWNGPEGTFLKLAGGQGKYEVTIRNLDGPRTFPGQSVDGGVAFERDGVQETVRASSGDATGMKWLAGKSDCLRVKAGEGYCRG